MSLLEQCRNPATVARAQQRGGGKRSRGAFNLNLVLIRSNTPGPTGQTLQTDEFDDVLSCLYEDDRGMVRCRAWPVTSDPGTKWLRTKLGRLTDGTPRTLIIAPGHHRLCWEFAPGKGHHKGYRAGRQVAPMDYCADVDTDSYLGLGYTVGSQGEINWLSTAKRIKGLFLTNLHRASRWKILSRIGGYSAGCTVFQRDVDLQELLGLVDAQIRRGYGSRCSVTVVHRQALS